MTELDKLNKILPDIFIRMDIAEKNKRVDSHCYIDLTKEEYDIIAQTWILQDFGYILKFEVEADS